MASKGYDLGPDRYAMWDYTPSHTPSHCVPTKQQRKDAKIVLPLIIAWLKDNGYLSQGAGITTFGTLVAAQSKPVLAKLKMMATGAYHPSPRGVSRKALLASFWAAMEPMRNIPRYIPPRSDQ